MTNRLDPNFDATWLRGWDVDDDAERTALLAIAAPLGPKRGDIIKQLDTGAWYEVTEEGDAIIINGGNWIDIPYNAGDFTGNGTLVWTVASGDVTDFAYKIVDGNVVHLNIRIEFTSVSGSGSILYVAIPSVIGPARALAGPALVFDDVNGLIGFFSIDIGTNQVQFVKMDISDWLPSTNQTSVYLALTYEI